MGMGMWQARFRVTTNRFFIPEKAAVQAKLPPLSKLSRTTRPHAKKVAKAAANDLGGVWAPRANWSDAKGLYDTEDVIWGRFVKDWDMLLDNGFGRMIMANDDDVGDEDRDGDGIPDEVEDVGEILWQNSQLLFQLFIYYATINGVSGSSYDSVGLNEWTQVRARKSNRLLSPSLAFSLAFSLLLSHLLSLLFSHLLSPSLASASTSGRSSPRTLCSSRSAPSSASGATWTASSSARARSRASPARAARRPGRRHRRGGHSRRRTRG